MSLTIQQAKVSLCISNLHKQAWVLGLFPFYLDGNVKVLIRDIGKPWLIQSICKNVEDFRALGENERSSSAIFLVHHN